MPVRTDMQSKHITSAIIIKYFMVQIKIHFQLSKTVCQNIHIYVHVCVYVYIVMCIPYRFYKYYLPFIIIAMIYGMQQKREVEGDNI